jgi:hypothetical protein
MNRAGLGTQMIRRNGQAQDLTMSKARACRHCGCTEENACIIGGLPCGWHSKDCCTNPDCVAVDRQKTHIVDMSAGSLYATHGTLCGIRLQERAGRHYANAPGYGEYIHPRSVVDFRDRAKVTCGTCLNHLESRSGGSELYFPQAKA